MDVDTRLLRCFAAVAEEGSLTRAAERLYVSQPALTKQIRRLEAGLGVDLFTRSRTGMALTEPGRTLARRVPALLAGWDAALARNPTRRTRAARRRPGWRADMRQAAWSNPSAGLADSDVDVALVRLPFPGQEALRVLPLFSEPRCVALAETHPLAARETIAFRELWDEPFVTAPPETGRWREYWLAADERDGHPVRVGAVTEHPDDWLTAIANGYGIALAPESAARFYTRPGVVYRPLTGVGPSRVAVAWAPADDDTPVVQDFVRCCRDAHTDRPDGT
jgi:DNA-binding transcriptional LysR family regulator